jgi:asparagine synthase (glutamine-hydrolysing)
MCGICGYVGHNTPHLLKPMCDVMQFRGPDDSGTWSDSEHRIGLGHRRLSIIDLSPMGHQPMANEDESIWLTYNGEVYNFPELRQELIKKGYGFRGHSDTEVVLYMYQEYGMDFLAKLNGIFALAIWDSRNRRLLLARDHAGIKPLYYIRDKQGLYFASEIKSLLKIPGIPRELDLEVLPHYLTFLWVPGPKTMLKGIEKVEPGHCLVWEDGNVEIKRWYNLDYDQDESIGEAEWVERVHEGFMAATRRQMMSDVPLGAFLSGGLDSSAIVACMRQSYPDREISCYTLGFDSEELKREGFENDFPYAKRVADHLGVTFKSKMLDANVVDLLPKVVYHMDEPDADPTAILTYIVAEMAHQDGIRVLLSGTGGDEVFFGYRSHQACREYERWRYIPKWLAKAGLGGLVKIGGAIQGAHGPVARRANKFMRGLNADGIDRHMALVDWSQPEIRDSILSDSHKGRALRGAPESLERYYRDFVGKGEINRHSHLLIQTFLAAHNFLYTDKCSMAFSVETRVPFMDTELMQLCARIPEHLKLKGSITKFPLKKAMERYLPRDVLYRSKTGFTPPLREWVAKRLDGRIRDALGRDKIRDRGIFDYQAINRIVEENKSNQADHGFLIYALLSLEVWMATFIDRPGEEISW